MWLVIAGWLSSALVFSTFFMKTMVPLRLVAIASNVSFMSYALLGLAYGVFGRLYPILILHAALLPLNLLRLREVRALIRAVERCTDEDAVHALVPYMRTERHAAGDVLFRRGDEADMLYVVQQGRVVFPELGKRIDPGAVFGEVGLFDESGRRSLTAVCEDDCRIATISREKTLELCYQNPSFGMFLIRLISGRALEGVRPVGALSPGRA
jgi:CRP/FNR family transcriptional regulator, cyclic AMP receptor protein